MNDIGNGRNEETQHATTQTDGANPTLPSLATIDKPVSADTALTLIRQTAVALSEASHSGFIHKNLRPETILIETGDPPIKLNFDAAASQTDAEDWDMSYASPEQREGKALDSRSNIYSLGIILHELIFGFPPDQASESTPEMALPEGGDSPISHQTTRVIETACRKEPWARYQTLEKFIAAVDEALLFETTTPDDLTLPPAALAETAAVKPTRDLFRRFFSRNNRLLPIGITILFLVLFTLAMFNSWSRSGTSSTIPIFQQLPLLLGGENSSIQQTREAEGATATIRALQIRLPSRTPTLSPTIGIQSENQNEPPIAGFVTNAPTSTGTATTEPTEIPTNPPPPSPTETPTDTPEPSPSPSPTTGGGPPPGVTNTPVPPSPTNSPEPTDFPDPTAPPDPTNIPQPTPTPPPGSTPTPPVLPTSTPQPTNTPLPTDTPQPTPTPPQ